ncbi:hypothetical protein P152DRAFT_465549 [Eremomyces bilateralis CBS 781.70]|uniref:Uncharacterized protein n=1 Tax=Eremomyces bilateralis CBS 781.70 TaxID=1392243 RepID=A0A6G1G6N1_9PEZI|nr:uncharacterized protein P152DRAFT_465549 [Eremomyces bilateralis CBS 781.70]KAF1813698.1 hypothetical protein P152DRAFT_465549 [Eremomyces bilateralis CBS 781.70]
MVVTVSDSDERGKASTAKERLGKSVFIGYPFLQEAKVVKVTDELLSYTLNANGQLMQSPLSPREMENFQKKSDRVEAMYSKKLGVVIGPVESIVHVEPLRGLKKTPDGATVKDYAEVPGIETEYAAQTVVESVFSEDQRFLEKAAVPFEEEFPIGARAFFLGEMAYGRPLEVASHLSATHAEVLVLTQKGKEQEFGRDIVRIAEQQTRYTPSFAVARMLHLSPLVLSRLTSAFSVNSSGLRLNLGLNLKFESKKQKVLGYSRKSTSGWEYSPKAVELIQQYMIRFPEFIAGVSANPKGDLYEDTDFYPQDVAAAKMKEIGQWLKSIEAKSFERVSLEAEQLDSDVVAQIEQKADQISQNSPPFERKRIKSVPRNAILKPSDAEQRIGPQRFQLGDRIVYVLDSGRVPIGLKGTVVGMTRTSRTMFLDVVFDHTFMSGSSLGERCSPFRGSTVPAESVLNLTDKQAIVYTSASSARNPNQAAEPLTVPGYYGAPAAAGGAGQYRAAPSPAPLRGSFRGALSRGNNGTPRGGARGQFQQSLPFRTAEQNTPPANENGTYAIIQSSATRA